MKSQGQGNSEYLQEFTIFRICSELSKMELEILPVIGLA